MNFLNFEDEQLACAQTVEPSVAAAPADASFNGVDNHEPSTPPPPVEVSVVTQLDGDELGEAAELVFPAQDDPMEATPLPRDEPSVGAPPLSSLKDDAT